LLGIGFVSLKSYLFMRQIVERCSRLEAFCKVGLDLFKVLTNLVKICQLQQTYSHERTDVIPVEVLHLIVPSLRCSCPVLCAVWSYALCRIHVQVLAYVKPGWNRKCEVSVRIPQTTCFLVRICLQAGQ